MDYTAKLQHHFKPAGWLNDPNGLVYFDGWYHVFYQHLPGSETPWAGPMHWGHARTKDFITWQTLPVALTPDSPYDRGGCWSGTALVHDGVLYLFYASILPPEKEGQPPVQSVSVASSRDGIHFEKYAGNPVIATYPADGSADFRDPAVTCVDGVFYCVMASGYPQEKKARLLLYRSDDLLHWDYDGIMCQWDNAKYTECPSFMRTDEGFLLTASVDTFDKRYFSVMHGDFKAGKFTVQHSGQVDKGPDQYAGQCFWDPVGRRSLLITWIPGWGHERHADVCVGCLSTPRQLTLENGTLHARPVRELAHLFTDSDPALQPTADGFVVQRTGRDPFVYKGEIHRLQILRDAYILEVFVNDGQEVFSILL